MGNFSHIKQTCEGRKGDVAQQLTEISALCSVHLNLFTTGLVFLVFPFTDHLQSTEAAFRINSCLSFTSHGVLGQGEDIYSLNPSCTKEGT